MMRLPPRSTLTYTLFPYPTLVRSHVAQIDVRAHRVAHVDGMAAAHVDADMGRRRSDRRGAAGQLGMGGDDDVPSLQCRSEEHTSELQSLMRISYAVFCLKKKKE